MFHWRSEFLICTLGERKKGKPTRMLPDNNHRPSWSYSTQEGTTIGWKGRAHAQRVVLLRRKGDKNNVGCKYTNIDPNRILVHTHSQNPPCRQKNPENSHKNAQKTSKNLACPMLLIQGRIWPGILLSMCLLTVFGSQGIMGKCTATIFFHTVNSFLLQPLHHCCKNINDHNFRGNSRYQYKMLH